jgi:hypothetical protein
MTLTFVRDPPTAPLIEHDENAVEINSSKRRGRGRGRVAPLEPRDGWIRPKHGGGMLKPYFKGHIGTRDIKPTRYNETLALARTHSAEAMMTLVTRLKDPDGRIAVVAANSVLERAWGKVREMKPEEQEKAQIDLSKLSAAELQLLMNLVESGRLQPAPLQDEVSVIEGNTSDD